MPKINVFPIEQPGGIFYYGKMKSKELIGNLKILRRSEKKDGIQRDLLNPRIKDISDYLARPDSILPTPIVISIENASLTELCDGFYLLDIPDEEQWGEIIDGQHRYEGLRSSPEFFDQEIPICIFVNLLIEDKATIFGTINSNQVKVPKSYIYDLFDYTDQNTPTKFCHEICKVLNNDIEEDGEYQSGPLYRRIKMLGRKLNESEVLTQAAFVDAIITLISNNEKMDDNNARKGINLEDQPDIPLRRFYINENYVVFAKILRNYLSALREISEDKWVGFVLKSIGMKVFIRLLSDIAMDGIKHGTLNRKFFHERLYSIRNIILECSTDSGTNKSAENFWYQKLNAGLRAANTTSS